MTYICMYVCTYVCRCLHPDKLPGQLGELNVPGGHDMASDKASYAGEAQPAHESGALPAPPDDGTQEIRRHARDPVLEVHGGEPGVDLPVRGGGSWTPVECRGEDEKDPNVPSLRPTEIKEALDELIQLSAKPMVIHRYHATRQMAETYKSPTLAMMAEVGARVEEAQLVWKRLHLLSQSAAWTAAGCFLRHERLKLGALATRLKSLTQ